MESEALGRFELEIRRRFEAGDLDGAMRVAIEVYGGEIYGFLVGLSRNRTQADDVFGAACEAMWRGFPKFRWESTLRIWAYTIARNEFFRQATAAKREVLIDKVPALREAMTAVRTTTPMHQRSEVHEQFARLREELAPEDHMLLGLRLDRKLAWTEIARVLGTGETANLSRDAAALRKRFERLKERLRERVVGSS